MSDIFDKMKTAFNLEGCICGRCVHEVISKRPFPRNLEYPFIVCANCGNKRCPKASWHGYQCSASNEVG